MFIVADSPLLSKMHLNNVKSVECGNVTTDFDVLGDIPFALLTQGKGKIDTWSLVRKVQPSMDLPRKITQHARNPNCKISGPKKRKEKKVFPCHLQSTSLHEY